MKRYLFGFVALGLLLAGCQGEDPVVEEPVAGPELVSSDPADGATEAPYGEMTLTLNFDANVICPTAQQGNITVDNNAAIVKVNASGKKVTVELEALEPETTYTISFPKGTVMGYKDNVAEAFSVSFTTKAPFVFNTDNIDRTLVTENPINNAVRLYDYLLSVYGKKTISSAIAKVAWNLDEIEWIEEWTGLEPAMATFDYIHLQSSPANWIDYGDITPAKTWFDKGGIVSACWHWNVPNVEGGTEYTCTPGDGNKSNDSWTTAFKPSNIFVEGTWENRTAEADLEKIAGYLKLLQDQNIPVIWRPLHEAAGNTYTQWKSGAWFWWGRDGGETYVRLWRYMFDYFKEAGIRNLIWVWTAQATSDSDSDIDFYPGDEYVDIVGKDIYNNKSVTDIKSQFDYVSSMVSDKMTTLSEFGNLPPVGDQWDAGAYWLYFMPWYDYGNDGTENYAHSHADIEWWIKAWLSDSVIDLSELPSDLYE